MYNARTLLSDLGYAKGDAYDLPSSEKRFPDGAQYRFELASVEGPAAVETALEESSRRGLDVHRLSQGSGIQMATDEEFERMLSATRSAGVELSAFPGPRGTWGATPTPNTVAGYNLAHQSEGMDRLRHLLDDVARGLSLGVRGLTIADRAAIRILNEARTRGIVPADLVIKASALAGLGANPVSAQEAVDLGVDSLNVPSALTLPQLAAIRKRIDIPIDIYVEAPDSFGGFVRTYDVPEIIRVAAPVYIKIGIRNSPELYPAGRHLEQETILLAEEKVHRMQTIRAVIERFYPEAVTSARGAKGLGVPAAAV
ncbi:hypothetical protein ACFY0A_33930 [Streptomyces sp. NPDC001698]|uniref:hypothetical protein n=1 Tax=unclassified Streptomyces TaxID=2593676 RepID=UPI00367DDE4B